MWQVRELPVVLRRSQPLPGDLYLNLLEGDDGRRYVYLSSLWPGLAPGERVLISGWATPPLEGEPALISSARIKEA